MATIAAMTETVASTLCTNAHKNTEISWSCAGENLELADKEKSNILLNGRKFDSSHNPPVINFQYENLNNQPVSHFNGSWRVSDLTAKYFPSSRQYIR